MNVRKGLRVYVPILFLGNTDSAEATKASRNSVSSLNTFFTICNVYKAYAVGIEEGRLDGWFVGCRVGSVVGCEVGWVG